MEECSFYVPVIFCNRTVNSEINFLLNNETFASASDDRWQIPYEFTIIILTLYAFTFVFGIVGNIFVCYIIYYSSKPEKINITHFFFANNAISDILMIIFCMPLIKLSSIFLDYWPFGAATCTAVNYARSLFNFQKSFILIAMTFDRYNKISRPFKQRIRKRTARLIILSTYLLAAIFSSPTAANSHVVFIVGNSSYGLCTEIWQSSRSKTIFTYMEATIQYFVPLLVMAALNMHTVFIIVRKKTPGEANIKRDTRIASTKRKSVKILVTLVTTFAVSWMPFEVLTLAEENDPTIFNEPTNHILWFTFHWMTMSNCCLNPSLYCLSNRDFREGLKSLFLKITCRRPHTSFVHEISFRMRTNSYTRAVAEMKM